MSRSPSIRPRRAGTHSIVRWKTLLSGSKPSIGSTSGGPLCRAVHRPGSHRPPVAVRAIHLDGQDRLGNDHLADALGGELDHRRFVRHQSHGDAHRPAAVADVGQAPLIEKLEVVGGAGQRLIGDGELPAERLRRVVQRGAQLAISSPIVA